MAVVFDFVTTEWLTIISLIIAVAMGAWAIRVSTKRTTITYAVKTLSVLGRNTDRLPPGVRVTYNGIQIPKLSRTMVTFWNSGNTTILSDQIIAADVPRFRLAGNAQLLDVRIAHSSRPVSEFRVQRVWRNAEYTDVELNFDFIEPDEGAVIECLHSGFEQGTFIGSLRGMKTPPTKYERRGVFLSSQLVRSAFSAIADVLNQGRTTDGRAPSPQTIFSGMFTAMASTMLVVGLVSFSVVYDIGGISSFFEEADAEKSVEDVRSTLGTISIIYALILFEFAVYTWPRGPRDLRDYM